MTKAGSKSITLHLSGLALAVVLGAACLGVYVYAPALVRGTFFQRIENIVIFASIVALLTAAERLWVLVTARFQRHPPQ